MQEPEVCCAWKALEVILSLDIVRVFHLAKHRQTCRGRAEVPSAVTAAFVHTHLEVGQQGERMVRTQYAPFVHDLAFEVILEAALRH